MVEKRLISTVENIYKLYGILPPPSTESKQEQERQALNQLMTRFINCQSEIRVELVRQYTAEMENRDGGDEHLLRIQEAFKRVKAFDMYQHHLKQVEGYKAHLRRQYTEIRERSSVKAKKHFKDHARLLQAILNEGGVAIHVSAGEAHRKKSEVRVSSDFLDQRASSSSQEKAFIKLPGKKVKAAKYLDFSMYTHDLYLTLKNPTWKQQRGLNKLKHLETKGLEEMFEMANKMHQLVDMAAGVMLSMIARQRDNFRLIPLKGEEQFEQYSDAWNDVLHVPGRWMETYELDFARDKNVEGNCRKIVMFMEWLTEHASLTNPLDANACSDYQDEAVEELAVIKVSGGDDSPNHDEDDGSAARSRGVDGIEDQEQDGDHEEPAGKEDSGGEENHGVHGDLAGDYSDSDYGDNADEDSGDFDGSHYEDALSLLPWFPRPGSKSEFPSTPCKTSPPSYNQAETNCFLAEMS